MLYSCSVAANGSFALLLRRGQPAVFVGDLTGDSRMLLNAHPITSGKLMSYPHAWWDNGQSVLYEQWHDKWELFQQQIDVHSPKPLRTPELEGVGARRSPDGRWIFFFRKDASGAFRLFHMRADGTGAPTELPVPSGDLRCPHSGKDCVLRVKDANAHFLGLYGVDPETGATHFWRMLPWDEESLTDWDVSPDGGSVVLCGPTSSKGVLRIFDLHSQAERIESFPVDTSFRAVNWNSNGKGWFAVTYSSIYSYLYYVGVDHTASLLRQATYPTWGVPSPDGRKLAFVDLNQDRNVWLTHESSDR
jgi:Tol biopolymer transport system component